MKKALAGIGWAVLICLALAAYFSPPEYKKAAFHAFTIWAICCAAYGVAAESKLGLYKKLQHALTVSLVFGVLAAAFYGAPMQDHDGNEIDEGFVATSSEMIAAGIRIFLKMLVGSTIGVCVSEYVNKKKPKI